MAKQYSLLDFLELNEEFFVQALHEVFGTQHWLESFLNNSHHGIGHGFDVSRGSLTLINNLTDHERAAFKKEGEFINPAYPIESATATVIISASLHDCGRFDSRGKLGIKHSVHPALGANRAMRFCGAVSESKVKPYIKDAILSHDYQSDRITPFYTCPTTTIGAIVQSADQLGWFYPESPKRTLECGAEMKRPLYDSKLTLEERMDWQIGSPAKDTFTVMLAQIYGPCNAGRFGIAYALNNAEQYKEQLTRNIVKLAEENGFGQDARKLIMEYGKRMP